MVLVFLLKWVKSVVRCALSIYSISLLLTPKIPQTLLYTHRERMIETSFDKLNTRYLQVWSLERHLKLLLHLRQYLLERKFRFGEQVVPGEVLI